MFNVSKQEDEQERVIHLLLQVSSGAAAQLRYQFLSLLVHALALVLAVSPGLVTARTDMVALYRAAYGKAGVVLVPPKSDVEQNGTTSVKRATTSPKAPEAGTPVDLTGLTLVIEPDPGFELMKVLAAHEGFIGFADPAQPGYVSALFAAPDWQAANAPGMVSVDDYFTVKIAEPERWPAIDHLRRERGLEDDKIVYALLPPQFHDRVLELVRHKAMQSPRPGRLSAAHIAFSAAEPNGFTVTDITAEPAQ